MQITEFSFLHLHEAHEQRLAVELERQRAASERRAEGAAGAAGTRSTASTHRRLRAAWARLRRGTAAPARANEPCVACP